MKKFLCICMALCMIASMVVSVNAVVVEKEQYSVDLPGNFAEVEESRFIGDNSKTFVVNIDENTADTICVADMSERDIEKYTEDLTGAAKTAFGSIGREGSAEVLNAEVKNHPNGRRVLAVTFKTSAEGEGDTTVLYQRIYEFSCVNNHYVFVYTAHNEKELDEFNPSFDSITINEAEDKGFKGDVGAYIIVAVLFGLFAWGIVRFIRTPAKRKAGKLNNKKPKHKK